jgi:hypothetical protein
MAHLFAERFVRGSKRERFCSRGPQVGNLISSVRRRRRREVQVQGPARYSN